MEEDPFDFESDILLATSPVVAPKRRKKVIGLDDLLADHHEEKNKAVERERKLARGKSRSIIDHDEDEEDGRVAKLSKYVNECHEKMTQLSDEDDVFNWGLLVFGEQKAFPSYAFSNVHCCSLFHSIMSHEVNTLVELSSESGEIFFEGLLADGWLLTSVCKCGEVDESIAKWTFHLMLYSSKEVLRRAAVDFWCAILLLKNEDGSKSLRIDWLPGYPELKGALERYGFLFDEPTQGSSDIEMDVEDSESMGPPHNIRAWIKYVAACSQARDMHVIFSPSDSTELIAVIICLLLDRQLIGITIDLSECLLALVNFFTDEEWRSYCTVAARSVALRVPKDINSLRAVECIPAVCGRTKLLRSTVAFQVLLSYFDEAEDEVELMRQLSLFNLKDKDCDLFKIYIFMVLTENWFLYNSVPKHKPLLNEMWGLYLRNCSCQINITDTRSYASKVRSRASYLLQGTSDRLL
uniref:uncharacterized protein LOC122585176 n=1 Tax=Erigeron canadensis TaxID=72917 RepID=UPI001CB9C87A|nr:uncharacterized protein LOC122585176 [Erigeron canadensis]